MLKAVAGILKRYHMLPEAARVGVAVSGGADSVCLLDVLAALAPAHGWALTVLHLNHGWRGDTSDEDARFVGRLAARYGFRCVVERMEGAVPESNLEARGREARRRFFAAQMAALPLDRIATGHTLDDQAETVLFRALRGAGPGGLAGILPVTAEGIVRPLLEMDRAAVGEYLRERGLEWREDATNSDVRFRRNALRAVLPELSRLVNPEARQALARLANIALEEEAYWERLTGEAGSRVWREEDGALVARIEELMGGGRALARRLVRRAMGRLRGGLRAIDHDHVERVLAMAERERGEGRMDLPGMVAERSCGWLRLGAGPVETLREKHLTGDVVVRGWRAGDLYDGRPFRDRLRARNVPRWRRTRWRVAAAGRELLWAEGFGWSAAGWAISSRVRKLLSEIADVSI